MSRLARTTYIVALVLVIGGFGAIGAAAGLRVAIGTTTQVLDCSARACVPLIREYNSLFQTFFLGGAVAMVCGFLGVWSSNRQLDAVESEAAEN